MDLLDKLNEIAARIEKTADGLQTEGATKTALVMPFIQALGYDVFNPLEVAAEFTADVGIKKGEKVDYAILKDGQPIMLFECKTLGSDLEKLTPSQLYRYFSVTEARFGVFTDGVRYQFFTDLEAPNKMDPKPFFEFDVQNLKPSIAAELRKFGKQDFDVETVMETASELKFTKGIMRSLSDELLNPSEEFVKLFCSRVYSGRITQAVKDQFTEITKRALQDFVNERVNMRLKSALEGEYQAPSAGGLMSDTSSAEEVSEVVTTDEELEAYYVVKSIVRKVVDAKRVYIRDTQSYCGVLLDDNNRKPICRFYFNGRTKYLGLLDEEKKTTRHVIQGANDIYGFAEELCAATIHYSNASNDTAEPSD
jgi:hypothetical protein